MPRLATRALEPLWLLAMVLVPLTFDPFGPGQLDVQKAWVVRILGAALLGCWIVSDIGGAQDLLRAAPRPLKRSVAIGFLLLVAGYVASTLTSVAPWASTFGEDVRGQGVLTFAAYAAVFLCIATTATRKQARHAIVALLLTSAVVLAYWLIQVAGGDPFSWNGAPASTLGNTSFLRGYLTMVAALLAALNGRWCLVLLGYLGVLFLVATVLYRPLSVGYRLAMWSAVPAVIAERPLTGFGPETELLTLLEGPHSAVLRFEGQFGAGGNFQDRTENLELDTLLERGVLGLIGLLAFFGAVARAGWRSRSVFLAPLGALLLDAQFGVMSTTAQFYAFVLAGLIVAEASA